VPAFGQRGKKDITVRHLLTHRAGIPNLPTDQIDLALLAQPERILELLCASRPTNRAGRRLAYHALTSGWVLGQVVKSVTGQEIGQVLRQEILDPLGIQHMGYGVSAQDIPRVAQHAFTGPAIRPPFAGALRRALGVSFEDAVRFSNDPRFLQATVPAGNVIGTAEEVCRFFEVLLRGGALGPTRVFSRRTIARATAEQEYLSVDTTFGIPVRYSMGFILGGKVASLYGPDTEEAFGHLGFTTVTAWADPARDVSACLMTSGKHFLTLGLWPHLNVLRAIGQRCPRL
jgi:CubicO group peptidase (beta-lactamase class C family)